MSGQAALSTAEHKRQGLHNETIYAFLFNSDQNAYDWCITLIFYASIHYSEFYLKNKGSTRTRETHDARVYDLEVDAQETRDFHIPNKFKRLRRESRAARYYLKYLAPDAKSKCLSAFQNDFLVLKNYFLTKIDDSEV